VAAEAVCYAERSRIGQGPAPVPGIALARSTEAAGHRLLTKGRRSNMPMDGEANALDLQQAREYDTLVVRAARYPGYSVTTASLWSRLMSVIAVGSRVARAVPGRMAQVTDGGLQLLTHGFEFSSG